MQFTFVFITVFALSTACRSSTAPRGGRDAAQDRVSSASAIETVAHGSEGSATSITIESRRADGTADAGRWVRTWDLSDPDGRKSSLFGGELMQNVELDAEGRARLADLAPGWYGFAPCDEWLARSRGESSAVFVRLHAGEHALARLGASRESFRVRGRVVVVGTPAAGLEIVAVVPGFDAPVARAAVSDSDGTFELELGARTLHEFSLGPPRGALHWRVTRDLTDGDPGTLAFDLPNGSLRGRVFMQDGSPVPVCQVELCAESVIRAGALVYGELHCPDTVQNVAGGVFAFERLPPGRYRVSAKRMEGTVPWHELRAASDAIDLRAGECVAGLELKLRVP